MRASLIWVATKIALDSKSLLDVRRIVSGA